MSAGVVTAAAVQVRVGHEFRVLERGAVLPDGVAADEVSRLVAKGLVAVPKSARGAAKAKADAEADSGAGAE